MVSFERHIGNRGDKIGVEEKATSLLERVPRFIYSSRLRPKIVTNAHAAS